MNISVDSSRISRLGLGPADTMGYPKKYFIMDYPKKKKKNLVVVIQLVFLDLEIYKKCGSGREGDQTSNGNGIHKRRSLRGKLPCKALSFTSILSMCG